MDDAGPLKLKLQILCGEEIAFGPGKAMLLDAIARTGSIRAAARDTGISYRRCWELVDEMNRCFTAPLVDRATGGVRGGGATVSALGAELLAHYRALMTAVERTAHGVDFAAIRAALRAQPLPPRA